MDEGPSQAQGQEYRRQMNGTGGDTPTGYRPCPFCHAVIPWESERCPSCGRVLVERVGRSSPKTPSTGSGAARSASSRSSGIGPALARVREAVQRIGLPRGTGVSSAMWSTTSRGTSWSVFQPTRRATRPRWLGSIPAPTERERLIVLVASALMIALFLVALLFR